METANLQRAGLFGYPGWRLESRDVRVDVLPPAGGKITSLFAKRTNIEWLLQPDDSNPFQVFDYGTEYNPNQCGGWEEMFPTILSCPYPAPGPWQGIQLPDHGELWTLPWQDEGTGDGVIRLTVDGKALPYRFSRSIAIDGGNEVILQYKVANMGDQPLAYLWTPHPQFVLEPGSRIILPAEATEVVNVFPDDDVWGAVGTRNSWPVILRQGEKPIHQDIIAPSSLKRGRKFYLPPEQAISWIMLMQPDGSSLRMSWDVGAQPYCGVWIDEGFLNKKSDVGLEPATGYYDELGMAWRNNRVAVLPAGASVTWPVRLTFGSET
ncbi:MAG: hypothetical protein J5I90_18985 [Caldilineales bacterium]|nr:hypothetical protein [Caldilineales bacterium]